MDYNGHFPQVEFSRHRDNVTPLFPKEEQRSELQKLIDNALVVDYEAAREELLNFLILNPGVVATFNQEFIAEMGPMRVNSLPPSPEDRSLNEYRFEVVQPWCIRRRTEDDGPVPLGGDAGGEARSD